MLELFSNLNPVASGIVYAIGVILLLTIVLVFWVRGRYKRIIRDLESPENRVNFMFKEKMNNKMVEDYRQALEHQVDEVNTPAIIEKEMARHLKGPAVGERIVSRSISLMIILGLLGTFYGLTLSIGEIVTLLASTKGSLVNDMTPIIDGLMNALQGMSVAFVTSLCGIGGSILVTIINMFVSVDSAKEHMMVSAEEYLDHYMGKGQRKQTVNSEGEEQAVTAGSIDTAQSIRKMAETMSTRLGAVALEMANTTTALNGSLARFEKSINVFSENTREFSEFNHEFRTNIQRMNVSFDDFSSSVQKSTKDLKNGHQVLSNTLEIINQENRK